MQKLVTISARLVLAFNLSLTLIFVSLGKYLLTRVFGPEAIDAYPSLLILLIGQVVNSFIGSVGFLLNMTGHEKDVMKAIGFSTLLNIILTFILTPILGIIGTAFSISLTLIISQIAMFFIVKKRLGIISSIFGKSN